MPQDNRLSPSGLWDGNPLAAPPGALTKADNVALRRPGILESFPGRQNLSGSMSGSETPERLAYFRDTLIAARDAGTLTRHDGASTYTDFSGDHDKPDSDNKVRFAEAVQSLFFTRDDGVGVLDSPTGTPRAAGLPRALEFRPITEHLANFIAPAAGGFLAPNYTVGYRYTVCLFDAQGRLLESAPSGRLVVSNEPGIWLSDPSGYDGTVANLHVFAWIPRNLTTSHFLRLYRTAQVPYGQDPGEEMYLVQEHTLSGADLIDGDGVQLTDTTPDELLGPTAYFAPSQQGIQQANDPPPLARHMVPFRNAMLYANTTSKHRLFITILGDVGTTAVTLNGLTYTPDEAATDTGGIFDNGDPTHFAGTISQLIEQTAKSFVEAVNKRSTNTTLSAYYLSSSDELPGKLVVEESGIGGSSFSFSGGAAGIWRTSGGGTSTNDRKKNRLWWSKADTPDAVPLVHHKDIGSESHAILGLVALTDSVLIFKEDGLWRLTGSGPSSFDIEPLDSTLVLKAPDTLVAFENRAWGVFNKGVLAISESGAVEPVGFTRIDETVRRLVLTAETQLKAYGWGMANELRREYEVHLPNASSDTGTVQAFVYNAGTSAWTRKVIAKKCGIAPTSAAGRVYYGNNATSISRERSAGTSADFQDESGSAIAEAWAFVPFTGDAPASEKAFLGATLLFAGTIPSSLTVTASTPRASVESNAQTLTNGTSPAVVPVSIPAEKSAGPYLKLEFSHSTAQEQLEFCGVVVDFKPLAERGGR